MAKKHELVPGDFFSGLDGWNKLRPDEQATIKVETIGLAEARVAGGFSKIKEGEHLTNIQAILEPQRMFLNYLKQLNFSYRTAYRYMQGYREAQKRLPEPVLRQVLARGYDIVGDNRRPLGNYTDIMKRLPAPKTDDPEVISKYLDTVDEAVKRKQHRKSATPIEEEDPKILLKESFRYVDVRRAKISKRRQAAWVEDLAGMLLARCGVGSSRNISPAAVPDGFQAVRGRPRIHKDESEQPAA